MSETTGRLFFALWPDESVAAQLAQRQAALEGGRLSHERDFHLTLAFLGVQPRACLPELAGLVEEVQFERLDLVLDMYGEFSRQKVVWAGSRYAPETLFELRSRLVQMPALAPLSFRREKTFTPHVTLARKASLPKQDFEPLPWSIRHLALAESVERQSGPRYRILACRRV